MEDRDEENPRMQRAQVEEEVQPGVRVRAYDAHQPQRPPVDLIRRLPYLLVLGHRRDRGDAAAPPAAAASPPHAPALGGGAHRVGAEATARAQLATHPPHFRPVLAQRLCLLLQLCYTLLRRTKPRRERGLLAAEVVELDLLLQQLFAHARHPLLKLVPRASLVCRLVLPLQLGQLRARLGGVVLRDCAFVGGCRVRTSRATSDRAGLQRRAQRRAVGRCCGALTASTRTLGCLRAQTDGAQYLRFGKCACSTARLVLRRGLVRAELCGEVSLLELRRVVMLTLNLELGLDTMQLVESR
mmetsp:Transcript_71396/g.201384  ORF Transcript_71396/g.201384 Transcript_71396/m.201384 type:complete len:299 (+) Transcript_71396:277-1173(+)